MTSRPEVIIKLNGLIRTTEIFCKSGKKFNYVYFR
jgi:hypothetical protein